MNRKQFGGVLVVTFFGALLGGMLTSLFLSPEQAIAKPRRLLTFPQQSPQGQYVQGMAQAAKGNSIVRIGNDASNHAVLSLHDKAGVSRLVLMLHPNGEPNILMLNQAGQTVWRAR